jgi:very-short-patch-repair endonuclease
LQPGLVRPLRPTGEPPMPKRTPFRSCVDPIKFEYAKQLRKSPTVAEKLLWDALKHQERRLRGHRVRRQHVILGYIADLYVPAVRLVVEIDGSSHDDRGVYDAKRDEAMKSNNIDVLRLKNESVLDDVTGCIALIERKIEQLEKIWRA